jgi:Kef-type K+ transport system membrane component KefB
LASPPDLRASASCRRTTRSTCSRFGVAVLLFVVGLRLDLQHVRHIGPVALATGLGQLGFTIAFGYLIVVGLWGPPLEALYVAVALTFSSTIIIVKLLADKRELDSLHGRIAVGFLIVQDLAVVLAMMAMSALRSPGEGADPWSVGGSLALRTAATAVALFGLMRWVLPLVVTTMARSAELLLVFAVAWGLSLATLSETIGFSKEAGAFLAGFSLGSTPYREAMSARLGGLRDFPFCCSSSSTSARGSISLRWAASCCPPRCCLCSCWWATP